MMMVVFSLVLVSVVTRHRVGDVDRNIHITVACVEERGEEGGRGKGEGRGERRGGGGRERGEEGGGGGGGEERGKSREELIS